MIKVTSIEGGLFMNPKEFGDALRKMRNELGLTQEQLGEKAGFKKSYLSLIENGKSEGLPQPETLKKLATGLNVDYHTLMSMAGYIDPKKVREILLYNKPEDIDINKINERIMKKTEKIKRMEQDGNTEEVERINQEIKKLRTRKSRIELANKLKPTDSNEIDLHELLINEEHTFSYKGELLSSSNIQKVMKFIGTFILDEDD